MQRDLVGTPRRCTVGIFDRFAVVQLYKRLSAVCIVGIFRAPSVTGERVCQLGRSVVCIVLVVVCRNCRSVCNAAAGSGEALFGACRTACASKSFLQLPRILYCIPIIPEINLVYYI